MSMISLTAARTGLVADDVIGGVRAVVETELAPIVKAIDIDGVYPDAALRALGKAGLFRQHLAAHAPDGAQDVGRAIAAMTAVGTVCLSTSFCTWCQDAAGWYLENTDNTALRDELQAGIASGAVLGGTGLSNPMKAFSGIEGFKLRAQRAEGGWVVSGILPWVSNLGDGHWFGTVFEDAADASHRIMAMIRCGQPGVEIRQAARFHALEGTGTFAVLFRRAFIADAQILADPAVDLVKRIKAGFILLQTGMGLGVIRGCIDLMYEADRTHAETNAYLPKRPAWFEAELAALDERIMQLAVTPHESDTDYMRQVLTARLNVSELSLEASQAAMLHAGARGYIHGSAFNRRLRESYFVAIVTPSIKHLQQELARLAVH